jgi:hypothetical protein
MPGILRLGLLLLLPAIIGAIPTPQDAVPAPKEAEPQIGQEDFSFKKAWDKAGCAIAYGICKPGCGFVCPSR